MSFLLRFRIEKAMRQSTAKLFRGMSIASDSSRFSSTTSGPTWSKTLSFASPESDFVSASKSEHMVATESDQTNWSESISYASPESDFVSALKEVHMSTTIEKKKWSKSISFASPESDFVASSKKVHLAHSAYGTYRDNVNSLSEEIFETQKLYPLPETATGFIPYAEMIDENILETTMKRLNIKESLPKTMKDALNDERPIVITTTESPFCIVEVNGAWENLCGYRREEAIGRNLGRLLQGPDTDVASANKLIGSLQKNGFSETIITNYSKNGRRFKNHIQVGMLPATDESGTFPSNDTYFVGVLHDISERTNQKVAAM